MGIFLLMPDEFESEGPDNLEEPPSFFPYDADSVDRVPLDMGDPVEVRIDGVFRHDHGSESDHFVVLTDGERRLPIVIGRFESQAILLPMEQHRPDRPMTHDLVRNIIERLGGTVERVVIDDLWNTTYYAKLYMQHSGEEIEIDARPSDAIALAIRFEAPIYVSEGILESATEE